MLTSIALVVLMFGFLGIRIPFIHANPDITIIAEELPETNPVNRKRTVNVPVKKTGDYTTGKKEAKEYRFVHYDPPYQNEAIQKKEEALFDN